jgi:hypothetical protein
VFAAVIATWERSVFLGGAISASSGPRRSSWLSVFRRLARAHSGATESSARFPRQSHPGQADSPSTLKRDSSRLFGRQRKQARSSTWVYSSGALRSLTSAGSRSTSAEETERVTPTRIPQPRIPQIQSVPDRIQLVRVDPLGARRADRSLILPLRRTISATIFRSERVPIRSRSVRIRALDAGDVNGWRACCDSSANGLRI